MRIILLKFILCIIVIAIGGGCIFYVLKNNHDARQLATPEQLTEIAKQPPCAAEAFKEALEPDPYGYQPGPLNLREAKKIASDCIERNEMIEMRQARENEIKLLYEEQVEALRRIGQ
ncbi:hypothetical protein AB2523_25935 [Klebsiella michiganensis]|uniref:hypothetical protein n=1 Tax=Klebsiella michiganensis TaxID=1134687 RepID=UPI003463E81C